MKNKKLTSLVIAMSLISVVFVGSFVHKNVSMASENKGVEVAAFFSNSGPGFF